MPSPYGPKAEAGPPGLTAKLLGFCEELRGEGVALGTSELLDAFSVLDEISWTDPVDFREALAATLAKSPEDRHVLDVLFDRFFFRAVEREALERDAAAVAADQARRVEQLALRERIAAGTELQRGFMINYNLYRHYFPLMALGRARRFLAA